MPKKVTARTAIRLHFTHIFLTSGTLGLPLALFCPPSSDQPVISRFEVAHAVSVDAAVVGTWVGALLS